MTRNGWIIYGANGYTGSRIARAAKAQGLAPILAGRNATAVGALADALGLRSRAFDLADREATQKALHDVGIVAHCAGPFSLTGRPMVDACLAVGAHYIDISGEIDVIVATHARDAEARKAGVALCPSMAFDSIPTDCLAATLKEALPDATHLTLGFTGLDEMSPGTLKTALEGIGHGMSRVREEGRIIEIPYFSRHRRLDFGDGKGEVDAFNIPWADVAIAYFSTGVPNVEVYVPAASTTARNMRLMRPLQPLLRFGAVVALLKRVVSATQKGPAQSVYEGSVCHVVGTARNARGNERVARVRCPNAYRLSVDGVLMAVAHLQAHPESCGFKTPSMLMGSRCVEQLPGVTEITVSQEPVGL